MPMDLPKKVFDGIKNILVYQPKTAHEDFVLNETENKQRIEDKTPIQSIAEFKAMLRFAKRIKNFSNKLIKMLQVGIRSTEFTVLKQEYEALEKQYAEISGVLLSYNSNQSRNKYSISTSLEENQKNIELLYQLPLNKDVVIRKLNIPAQPVVKAMLVFMDGLADKKIINMTVLQPLMLRANRQKLYDKDLVGNIIEECLPSGQASRVDSFKAVQQAVNTGDTVLFFDGTKEAVTIETKGFEHRGIDRPATEQSVRGSQNSFTEILRVNTALIRTMLHSSDLITEMIPVGMRGSSNCAVMYLKSVVNPNLIAEVRRRIKNISTDVITDSGILEHFITDSPMNPFPQTLSTERPDRVVVHIAEGRVAILLDGSPFGHIVPISLYTLMHSPDDFSLNLYYSNMLRIIRYIGAFLSLLLPGIYLAISTFHQEAIPTDLLLSISAARAQVPFPTIVEILLMETSFELIREGGLRIPGILGSTIGIVGALILGQAAVTAKIVSPIMVIVIAVTGLASYSIPDYRLSAAFRLFRFVFILLALAMGLVGISCGLIILIAVLSSIKSFGVPYLAPIAPKTIPGGDVILRKAAFAQGRRPDELNTKDAIRQGKLSRRWKKGGGES